jgi:PAS domain S-box-containing protein
MGTAPNKLEAARDRIASLPPTLSNGDLDLFDEASIGIVITTAEGRILRANRAFVELLERKVRQVLGRGLASFDPLPARIEELLGVLGRRQSLHNTSCEFLTRGRQVRHVLVDGNAVWENGRMTLVRWFVRDITRRKQLERELIELSERERRRFAQELHDDLGQQLGGIAYLSNVLRERLAERNAAEAGEADRIFRLVREAIEHTRRISRGLAPIRPEPEGLMLALGELARKTTELRGPRCRFSCRKLVHIEDSAIAGHLFRVAQEAVTNALRHAQPQRIEIRLTRTADAVKLLVSDDGKGMGTLSPRRQGLGLHIMQYRAALVHGTLKVRPSKSGGTEVSCTAPLAWRNEETRRPLS